MFCIKCQNNMDISNNISMLQESFHKGGKNQNNDEITYESDIDSSDITIDKIKHENVFDVLNVIDKLKFNTENFDIKDLNKNDNFNKLNSNQKTLTINKIFEIYPNLKIQFNKETDENNLNNESYFYCKNCGYYEKIIPKTLIFSKNNNTNTNNKKYNLNYLNYKYDNTLPFTKNYNCNNSNCSTHKNIELKNATLYKKSNYVVTTICNVCNAFWDSSSNIK